MWAIGDKTSLWRKEKYHTVFLQQQKRTHAVQLTYVGGHNWAKDFVFKQRLSSPEGL